VGGTYRWLRAGRTGYPAPTAVAGAMGAVAAVEATGAAIPAEREASDVEDGVARTVVTVTGAVGVTVEPMPEVAAGCMRPPVVTPSRWTGAKVAWAGASWPEVPCHWDWGIIWDWACGMYWLCI